MMEKRSHGALKNGALAMGRDKRNEEKVEHFTKMVRPLMQTAAWKALGTAAQALYPWIRLEWRGVSANNNGRLRLSVRQAAECLGVSRNTASHAFQDLQKKGFLVQTEPGCLGVGGKAKSPSYEITELATPGNTTGRRLYRDWVEGHDFPVKTIPSNNPGGRNGRKSTANVVPIKGGSR